VVLVGSKQALAVAVRTKGTGKRHTGLSHRLGGRGGGGGGGGASG
jgi:exodeoxyribonuclease V alpha subunit